MAGLDGLSPVIRGGFFDRSIIEEYQLSASTRLRRWQRCASGSRNSSNMVGKLGRSSVVAGRATCTTGSAPASAPATDSINRSYRFSPSVSLSLSLPSLPTALSTGRASALSLFPPASLLFLPSPRLFFVRYRYARRTRKKEEIWKRLGTKGEHRKKWHRGRKTITTGRRRKKRSETMRAPMEILVGSPFIYFAALPDFLL